MCAVLRGEPAAWPGGDDPAQIDEFIEVGRGNGVLPLLDVAFRRHKDDVNWPAAIRLACRQASIAQMAYELAHGIELVRVLKGLACGGIAALLLKGTGLAYGLYASPGLRPRADTDLLVPIDARDGACRILQEMGYRRISGPAGKFVGYQLEFHRTDGLGVRHNIDLHWRLNNAQTVAWLFSFDELASSAVPVPRIHSLAHRLGNVHALVLNLLHRIGSNWFLRPGSGDCLIWHYDIHLLIDGMSDVELAEFRRLVEAKQLGAYVIEGLRQCADRFGSARLALLIEQLAREPHILASTELGVPGKLHREWLELRAIPRLRDRLTYLAARAFPAREYMRECYPDAPGRTLAVLHARRMINGLGRMLAARKP